MTDYKFTYEDRLLLTQEAMCVPRAVDTPQPYDADMAGVEWENLVQSGRPRFRAAASTGRL